MEVIDYLYLFMYLSENMNMKLKNCTPVLFVKDAVKSRDFYVSVLGMTETMNNADLNFAFKEGLAIWQILPENKIPQKLGMDRVTDSSTAPRFELGFETESLEDVYENLKNHDVQFLHEMNEEAWGQRTIRFYDPDGHLIEVGEALEVFLRRVWEESGRDWAIASERVYTSVETLKKVLGEA